MIVMVVLLVVILNVFAQSKDVLELTDFSGKLKQIGDGWYFNTGKDIVELSLAPNDFLKENKIELASNMELTIQGIMKDDELIVHSIITKDKKFELRDEKGMALWEIKPNKVIANKCIGCRLCISTCPQNAITMVDGIAVIDAEKCDGCGICINGNDTGYKGCPVGAIEQIK